MQRSAVGIFVGSALMVSAIAPVCAMTQAELTPWYASSPKIHVHPRPDAPQGSELAHTLGVTVSGTTIYGYLLNHIALHGFLSDGQEIVVVPIASGGTMGVIDALVFTRVGGIRRFVGHIPSSQGKLGIALRDGALEVDTPMYGLGDANCCYSHTRVTSYTLSGARLVKTTEYIQDNGK